MVEWSAESLFGRTGDMKKCPFSNRNGKTENYSYAAMFPIEFTITNFEHR